VLEVQHNVKQYFMRCSSRVSRLTLRATSASLSRATVRPREHDCDLQKPA